MYKGKFKPNCEGHLDVMEAEAERDFREITDEIAYGVVEFDNRYYVLAKGTHEWSECVGPD